MRQKIERDRMRINSRCRLSIRSASVHEGFFRCVFHLLGQFVDCARAAAGNGLVTCSESAPHAKCAVQGVKGHQRDRCRAIWIGNQTAVSSRILRINFGNDQRHVRFHSKNRRVVDCDCVRLAGNRNIFPRDFAASAEKDDVDLIE